MSQWIEVFGTLASVIVAVSLTMKNIKRLRLLNALGSLCFGAYGACIGSIPVTVLNAFIVIIDAYYLYAMRSKRHHFETVEGDPYASPYIQRFLEFYGSDIARYQPEFKLEPESGWLAELILRDLSPVSLVVYRPRGHDEVELGLDYATPSYRDFKSAEYYFGRAAERIAAGRKVTFVATASVPEHRRYLKRMGFKPVSPSALSEYSMTVEGTPRT
jgi:hypothetical protein